MKKNSFFKQTTWMIALASLVMTTGMLLPIATLATGQPLPNTDQVISIPSASPKIANLTLPQYIGQILRNLLAFAGAITLIVFIWAGVRLMVSTDAKGLSMARDTFVWGTLGLVVMFTGYLVVTTLINTLTNPPSGTAGSTVAQNQTTNGQPGSAAPLTGIGCDLSPNLFTCSAGYSLSCDQRAGNYQCCSALIGPEPAAQCVSPTVVPPTPPPDPRVVCSRTPGKAWVCRVGNSVASPDNPAATCRCENFP